MGGTSTTRRRVRGGAALVAAVAALTACGGGQAGGGDVASATSSSGLPSSGPPSSGTTPAAAEETLTVTLDDGAGGRTTWTLTCAADGTPGGDHPDAVNACAALVAAAAPFAPVPKDRACTMVYGGPQTATVQGRWRGEDVLTTFKRTDGCEIARWDRVAPLLQPGTTAGRSTGAL